MRILCKLSSTQLLYISLLYSGEFIIECGKVLMMGNAIVWPMVFEKYRKLLLTSRLIGVLGKLEREQSVTHIVVDKLVSLDAALYEKTYGADEDFIPTQDPPDSALPKGRNFC